LLQVQARNKTLVSLDAFLFILSKRRKKKGERKKTTKTTKTKTTRIVRKIAMKMTRTMMPRRMKTLKLQRIRRWET